MAKSYKVRYNNKMTGRMQIDMEEKIASFLFDHDEVMLWDEVTAANVGRDVLYMVLREFRPDLFTRSRLPK